MGMLDKQVDELSRVLLTDLDTPVSLGVHLRVKYGCWDQLLSLRIDPLQYLDCPSGAVRFQKDYQAIELLRKYPDLPAKVDRAAVAFEGFWSAERQCFETNLRMDRWIRNYGLTASEIRFSPVLERIKTLISRWLGPVPEHLDCRFGPGSTFESKGHRFSRSFTIADKMSDPFYCTPSAQHLAAWAIWPTAWGRAILDGDDQAVRLCRGNRFTTVPKDATKDRGICIEPGGNLFLQLGVGRYIRQRLKKFGIDLKHGQDLHRALARLGSIAGELATIDLSSASDTVALKLVKLLLPEEWFDLLFDLRSPYTLIGKGSKERWVLLEKFSSMGNGFTFELETLIFCAIATAGCGDTARLGEDVNVYGDDIIVPAQHGRAVVDLLRYFGFTPNPRKTFLEGPFRESCGGDYFCGVEVTPYHLTENPCEPHQWIAVANGLRVVRDRGLPSGRARLRAIHQLPAHIRRLRGPAHLGDLVIHDSENLWITNVRSSIRYVKVWRPVARRVRLAGYASGVQLAVALYGAAEGERTNALAQVLALSRGDAAPELVTQGAFLTPRGGVTGYRTGRVAFS